MPCRKRFSARNSEGLDKAIQEELLDQKLIMFFFLGRDVPVRPFESLIRISGI